MYSHIEGGQKNVRHGGFYYPRGRAEETSGRAFVGSSIAYPTCAREEDNESTRAPCAGAKPTETRAEGVLVSYGHPPQWHPGVISGEDPQRTIIPCRNWTGNDNWCSGGRRRGTHFPPWLPRALSEGRVGRDTPLNLAT